MKKTTVSISCDEERLSALKMYLSQKNMQVEQELEKALEVLYTKTVPAGVREFIEMRSGSTASIPSKPKKPMTAKKPERFSSSAVGAADQEKKQNDG